MEGSGKDLGEDSEVELNAPDFGVPDVESDPQGSVAPSGGSNAGNLEGFEKGSGRSVLKGNAVVAARGTGNGLVLRLDGRADSESLKEAIINFVDSRKAFLSGNDVLLEWIGVLPKDAVVTDLKQMLSIMFNITVKGSSLKEQSRASLASKVEVFTDHEPSARKSGLFGGIENLGFGRGEVESESSMEEEFGVEALSEGKATDVGRSELWDDPDARIVYGTLRSGQKIETEHSIVIVGDVNSGAEIVAGGDVVVLGTLRGVAHAGAYDETGGGRFIFSLNLRPTQLRIGAVISRGSSDTSKKPEIARVDGNIIVVEPYNARNVTGRIQSW